MSLLPLTPRTWTSLSRCATRPREKSVRSLMTEHWGFEDPAAFEGSDEEKRKVFSKVYRQIMNRVSQFVNLPLHVLDRNAIQREMRAIGEKPPEESNEQP